ncbi:uncharacterized protein BDZ99DRAFT_423357 [Mytilinidion resinicola]|uniref:Dpy-30 domain-containing protein n=1 Tax=Mytilinidion resinicola TaxID=574789 RepID=A0A6A6YDA0_9PEZI|nr:uncharacterized protein BDZ99DRAFT_423357 [Mytilinidion resinicola]KAF2805974.1 hypothetical protein BDZ99DRAFT_423357 [Mytilinidion resinicola]
MAEASPNPLPADLTLTFPSPTANGTNMDIDMKEEPTLENQPVDPPTPSAAPTTPLPNQNTAATSAARSSPHPGQSNGPLQQPPANPIPHGSPTRVYLNSYVTPYLLEAMKHLATQEPDKPLKWLSEFLAEKSKELEG